MPVTKTLVFLPGCYSFSKKCSSILETTTEFCNIKSGLAQQTCMTAQNYANCTNYILLLYSLFTHYTKPLLLKHTLPKPLFYSYSQNLFSNFTISLLLILIYLSLLFIFQSSSFLKLPKSRSIIIHFLHAFFQTKFCKSCLLSPFT